VLEKILACPNLPTFPTIAVELLELTRDPDVSINDIAKLIKGDQGLASRVLKTVNSSFYGLSKPCSTIERAMGFLGIKAIKSLVLGFSVVRMTKDVNNDQGFDMDAYWRRTICSAAGARHVAVITGACDPDEAFTAGLFQDMGMLAAYTTIADQYVPVLAKAANDHDKLSEIEHQTLGFTHAQVGAELAQKWKMSDAIAPCVRYHHDPEKADDGYRELVKTVALGRMCAEAITSDYQAQPMADLIVHANEWFGKNHNDVEQLLNSITTASQELADVLNQNIGELPDAQQILTQANEQLAQQQILAQREAEQLQEHAQSLQIQTVTDTLTGAANRKKFDQEMLLAFERAKTQKKPLAVLFVDADHFKSVNDIHGHQAGDAVLVELAGRMMETVSNIGTVCRYGGEEFAILLPDVPLFKAAQFAELVRRTIAQKPFDLSGVKNTPATLSVQVSIGVSATDPDAPNRHSSADQLIQEADKAVYAAKENGRNCVRVFGGRREGEADTQWAWPDKPSADQPSTPPTRVLIVDPDALAARLLLDHFSRHQNTQVIWIPTYLDAIEAIQLSQQNDPSRLDLIVCELNLIDGDGTEIVTTAKHRGGPNKIRVVMVTTKTHADRTARALSAGADEVFFKDDIASKLAVWSRQVLETTRANQFAA